MTRVPHVLSIAGSDPSGGAGIQADLKSIAACGGYGMAAITALTAQNTRGVQAVHVPPPGVLVAQLDALAADVRIDAVKIGMLADRATIDVVRGWLAGPSGAPRVVLDPVLVATSGDRLLRAEAEGALDALLPLADVVTPNVPELAALVGAPGARTRDELSAQARILAARHGVRVLAKGGHLDSADCPDALVHPGGEMVWFEGDRIDTPHTHGTGCSLSSALATIAAAEADWVWAARLARDWLRGALAAADALDVGHGSGPVDHAHAHRAGALPPRRRAECASWWEDIAPIRADIDRDPFVVALGDGSLSQERFAHYLAQDAVYLGAYARVLAGLGEIAPSADERAFWAASARACVETEMALHRSRVAGDPPEPSPETRAYLGHLEAAAAAGDHGVLAAAVLPCFWIYDDVGRRLARASRPGHPYEDWLQTYDDPAFRDATREAIAWTQRAAHRADDAALERMREAFVVSARHERAFFAQRP
ncbi:bifunctional hydroxymethylpyrimidine kinase/phosphomethylpyrimidine kinase [Microbacterium excoecariae]|uniref:bifunctional hydroxymethylpyrimidine kinase/phosphomethylpyrimidine kinase n=1 Tax=Microbacterium excoecariae TaxID=2715210 RepID=UPI00140B2234|nr:bifunctional hydroxymethylpyrimidine kinase/phosphomethylpyrimidine kinase [Microbacterium excoecariae]